MNKQQAQERANELNLILKHTRFHASIKLETDDTYVVIVQDSYFLAEQAKKELNS